MPFWVTAALVIGSTLLHSALRRAPKNPRNRAKLDEFDIPTIEQGRTLPRIHGTVRMDSPSVTWYGDLRSREIRDEGAPVGFRYYMRAQLVFCAGPGVEIVKLLYDGKERPFTAQDFNQAKYLVIDMKGTRETKGTPTVETSFAWFHSGAPDQPPNGSLVAYMPGPVPAYGGVAYMVLADQFYVGDSTSAKLLGAVLRRQTNELGVPDGKHIIGTGRNPACIIYDELTAARIPYGGGGVDPAEIDTASLLTMAETLHSEGLGLSFVFSGGSVEDRIREVLNHVDGVHFRDPTTGLWTFRLVRSIYPTPKVFGPGTLRDFRRTPVAQDQQPTSVRVSFTDAAAGYQSSTVQIHNDAAIENRGGEVEFAEFEARGATTSAIAMKIATRFAAATTNPVNACSGYVSRAGWDIRPGDVIRIDWPDDGFTGLLIRVARVRLPSPTSDAWIHFEGIEDQFGIDSVVYAEPPPSGWVAPTGPGALTALRVLEAPPRLLGSDLTDGGHYALVLASRGSSLQDGFNILALDDDGDYRQAAETGAFCPRGLLMEDISVLADRLLISAPLDVELLRRVTLGQTVAGGSVLLVGDEMVAYRSIRDMGDGTVEGAGATRGVLDTLPAEHVAGAAVLFLSAGHARVEIPGPVGSDSTRGTTIKAQPFNSVGVLAVGSCPSGTVTVGSVPRSRLPGPPTRVLINGQLYPDSVNGKVTLLWQHRNRLEASSFLETNQTLLAETGTTYTLEFYGQAGTLIRTVTGRVDPFYEYSVVDELADSGLLVPNTSMRVRVWAVRDGSASWQAFDWTFDRDWP